MKSALIFLFPILLLFTSCSGQNQQRHNPYSIGQSVSKIDSSIWVVFQDKEHNYWFGSNGKGAYRYDGKNIHQYTTADGLYSNQIRGIQQDKRGNIYFETPEGISKFDGAKFTSLVPEEAAENQWKLLDSDLWFRRNGSAPGVYRYNGTHLYHLQFAAFNSMAVQGASQYVYSIYKDSRGHIWFGTLSAGVCRFDGRSLNWIYQKEMGVFDDGRVPAVRSILEDQNGLFWFSNTISRYNVVAPDPKEPNKIAYLTLPGIDTAQQSLNMSLPYYTSALRHNYTIWMTNYNEGVWQYDGKKLINFRLQKSTVNVLTMYLYQDNAGTLWLGTDNAGVYQYNGHTFEPFNP